MSLLRKWSHLLRFIVAGQDGLSGYPIGAGAWRLRGKGQNHTVRLRAGTSDFNVFKHIFVDPAYSFRRQYFRRDMADRYRAILAQGKTPLIIDCGANIGCSPLWFRCQYPEARIVAIEPEAENFRLLEQNIAGARIEALNKAVHSTRGKVGVVAGGDETAFRTVAAADGAGSIETVTIADVTEPPDELFIVKIDIEGFEETLFAANTEWIDRTQLIIIELHDHLFPGRAGSRTFFRALLDSAPRDFSHRGENIFSLKIA